MSSLNNTLVVVIGVVVVVLGLLRISDMFAMDANVFYKAFILLYALVTIATGVGFIMKQGWAYTLLSVGVLCGFMVLSIQFVLAFDSPNKSILGAAVPLVLSMCVIAYLSNWNNERHFRPQTADHH